VDAERRDQAGDVVAETRRVFVHLPLADFLTCFAGFTVEVVEELDDGYEYPKTIALALRKP
jgi:hypothetical protein